MTSTDLHQSTGQLKLENANGCTVATLRGELDYDNVGWWLPDLSNLLSEPNAQLVVDLSHIEEIDSGALGKLVGLVAESNTQSSRVILAGLRPYVAGVMEVTHLDRFFEVCSDVAEARARLAAG